MADRTIIKLQNGPGNGQEYYEEDFVERIRAAQRMGRRVPDAAGWALGYQRPAQSQGRIWIWRGVNCHPQPL